MLLINFAARLVIRGLRMSTYSIEERGSLYSMDYRVYFSELNYLISFYVEKGFFRNSDHQMKSALMKTLVYYM